MGSDVRSVLFAAALAAARGAWGADDPKVAETESPACDGSTTLRESSAGTNLLKTCVRRDGRRHGPFVQIYLPTGKVEMRGSYHGDKLHGDYVKYDVNTGAKKEEGTYREGNLHGWWVTFHKTGKKASEGEYANARKRGHWTYWDDKGRLVEDGDYRDGQKHGTWTTYDPATGKVLKETQWSEGRERSR